MFSTTKLIRCLNIVVFFLLNEIMFLMSLKLGRVWKNKNKLIEFFSIQSTRNLIAASFVFCFFFFIRAKTWHTGFMQRNTRCSKKSQNFYWPRCGWNEFLFFENRYFPSIQWSDKNLGPGITDSLFWWFKADGKYLTYGNGLSHDPKKPWYLLC